MTQPMNNRDLRPVWSQVEKMLLDGISVIPVRDKTEGEFGPKTPYKSWKQYQQVRITKEELWHQMEQKGTTAVAMICGEISGNLEVIDIDVKWKPGIDALLFNAIQQSRPDLWNILRIHQSPSGGFHIPYRVAYLPATGMPGNLKLAKRPPSEEELQLNPKDRAKCFIETRGEGGYVLAPPSLGYLVHQERPIPLISWEDRESLINICRLLDDMPKIAPKPPRSKADSDYYSTSPWDAFNHSPAAEEVLLQSGWKYAGRGGDYIHYTRPGKDKGISASFIISRRLYYIFSSNGGVDAERGYHPSTLLSDLAHNGDRKATYRWLVQQGYGVINPKVEAAIVRKAALTGKGLPTNISAAAVQEYQDAAITAKEQYPFGIFWVLEEDKQGEPRIAISRERFTQVADGLGFRYYRGDVVRVEGPTVHRCNDRAFFDTMKGYIKEEDAIEYYKIADATEGFIQRSGAFTITRLPLLLPSQILRDTATEAWKAYQDVVVKVTAEQVELHQYANLPALVWADKVQQRPFRTAEGGRYVEFLELACEYTRRKDYIQRVIGYLSHDFKDETTGFIIVLTEQCPDPRDGGGSGKNMFGNLLRYTTTYVSKAGSQTKFDEKFFQVWKGERVFAISDVPKHFDFAFLKEPATGSGVLKKLFKDEEVIPVEDMPKFMVQTNFSYEISDGGLKRRIIPIEFTDFFTQAGGIDVHFGCHFPLGWDEHDWAGYDGTIISSIQAWLRGGRKIRPGQLTETGWKKQFEHTYGTVITEIIAANIDYWKRKGFVSNEDFRKDLDGYYVENGVQKQFQPSSKKLSSALTEYCLHNSIEFKNNVLQRAGFGVVKGRIFGQEELPF